MPNCHLCNGANVVAVPTDFECPHCYSKQVTHLCKKCAWWYFSTHLRLATLPDTLKSPNDRARVNDWVVACPRTVEPTREEESRQRAMWKDVPTDCPTLAYQAGHIRDRVSQSVALWKRLFYPQAGRTLADEKRLQFMETLILVFWSSLHLAKKPYRSSSGSKVDVWLDHFDYIHAHDIPKIAEKHLESCFNKPVWLPAGTLDLGKAVLGQSIVERYLKQKINLGLAGTLLNKISIPSAGGIEYPGETLTQTIMHFSAQLFQATFFYLPTDPATPSFFPRNAVAYRTDEMAGQLFNGYYFSATAKNRLAWLYHRLRTTFSDRQPLFPDPNLAPNLNPAVEFYLQMLPTMDHSAATANMSPCEIRVRDKVKDQLKDIFTTNGTDAHPDFEREFPAICGNILGVTAANKQITNAAKWDDLLDRLIAGLNSDRMWLEITFSQSFSSLMLGKLQSGAANWTALKYINDYELKKKQIRFKQDLLTLCNPAGSFWGVDYSKAYRITKTDGRHLNDIYWDWRADKDFTLYEGYLPSPGLEPGYAQLLNTTVNTDAWLECLPVFASLAPATQFPLPNYKQYGHNTMVLDPSLIRRRCVFTMSDDMPTRRSSLLLLYDLLYDIPPKSQALYYDDQEPAATKAGKEGSKLDAYTLYRRCKMLLAIVDHLEYFERHPPAAAGLSVAALRTNWNRSLSTARTGQASPIAAAIEDWVPSARVGSGGAYYFECHIFGDLKPSTDAKGFLLETNENPADTNTLQGLLAADPNLAAVAYEYQKEYMESGDRARIDKLNSLSASAVPKLRTRFYNFKQ